MSIRSTTARVFERIGHPLFLAGAIALWWAMGRAEAATLVALVGALVAMEVLERLIPAYPGWRQTGAVERTGIGPQQPSFGRLFLLPFREPVDADTVASRRR